MSDEVKVTETQEEPKKGLLSEKKLEIFTAIFLGITALLTSWAGWIGSLHGGNQSTNYTESNNYSSLGNSEWNEASQSLMQDMIIWNDISDLMIESIFAEEQGDEEAVEKYDWKMEKIITDNCSPEFAEAISWAMENMQQSDEFCSPFEKEGYVDSYYDAAREYLDTSEELLEQGKKDNSHGDAYNLVTVIYSVVLFLLGIVGIFKNMPNRAIILCVALVGLVIATIYMFTIPLPTGFSFSSFFGAK